MTRDDIEDIDDVDDMDDVDETVVRDAILLATLPNVAFDGWVERVIDQGVEDAGYTSDMMYRVFPGGPPDMVRHWSDFGDRTMQEEMAELDLAAMSMRERITTAVRLRIEFYEPHREAVRRTLAHLVLPANAGVAVRNLRRTMDAIWYSTGDRSTTFSYYTKRAILAPIYVSTVLYWLDDESEDSVETWGFLRRRVAEAMQFPELQARLRAPLHALAAPLRFLQRAAPPFRRGRHA